MPGLAGITSARASDVTASRFVSLESGLARKPAWVRRTKSSVSGDFVTVVLAATDDHSTAIASSENTILAFDGEVFGVSAARSKQADYLLTKYEENGIDAFNEVEGRFVVAIWNERPKRLTLVTDRFASKPIYYRHHGDEFAFSTSINAIKSLAGQELQLNHDGVVQFFTFGHLWNNDTFYESIHAAEAAACIEFDVNESTVRLRQYWRPGLQKKFASTKQSLDALTDTLAQSVDQQSLDHDGLGVALSGGLDARTVLGLIDGNRVHPTCVSLGMEGSLDQQSARRLAELAGCRYESLILGEGFLEGFLQHLQTMVDLTDGHYLSQCIVMPTLPLYESLGVRSLMRGHVGELLHMHKAYNFSVDESLPLSTSRNDLECWLSGRLQSHLTADVKEPLLVGMDKTEFSDSGRHSLQQSLRKTDHFDHPLDRVSQLFLDQRTRRETAMSLVKFNSVVDPRLPFLNGPFVDAVFSTDPQLRVGETIQAHILRERRPEFLAPKNSNTGAPVGVSSIRRTMSYYKMRVLAKIGVKGYQPYERLGLWLKRELRPVVEEILLNPQCLDRGLLNPECVRGVVQRHMDSQANHTYLLMAMMIVELGLRRNSATEPTALAGQDATA